MSNQADVQSIEALKDLRVALALFAEEALGALGGVEMEVRRTIQWLQHDRQAFWQQQIKLRREQVAAARAELFRRQLAKTPEYSPSTVEHKELLRRAEASLEDAERRAALVKKWEPALQQAILEYHGSIRRIKDLTAGDVPRAMRVLERMVDALEAYLRVTAPTLAPEPARLASIAETVLDDDARAEEPGPPEPVDGDAAQAPAAPPDGPQEPRSLD